MVDPLNREYFSESYCYIKYDKKNYKIKKDVYINIIVVIMNNNKTIIIHDHPHSNSLYFINVVS